MKRIDHYSFILRKPNILKSSLTILITSPEGKPTRNPFKI